MKKLSAVTILIGVMTGLIGAMTTTFPGEFSRSPSGAGAPPHPRCRDRAPFPPLGPLLCRDDQELEKALLRLDRELRSPDWQHLLEGIEPPPLEERR